MKSIKFIQINIYKGKFLDGLLNFLKKEDPDFVSMQEVTRGKLNFYKDKKADIFKILRSRLDINGIYWGDLKLKNDPFSYLGNAVFSKFKIKSSKVVVLKKFRAVTLEELDGSGAFVIRPQISRHLLGAVVNMDGVDIHAVSVHGAWTAPPVDTLETLRQAQMVADYLKSLNGPFILGCDMNALPQSRTVGVINKVVNNLMMNTGVVQTLHPKVHEIAPKGFLVDYIFASKHFKLKSLHVPEVTISDHLPVVAKLELDV